MKLFDSTEKRTGINVTALVDILFLLIIFFTVSTQFTNQQSIGVNLPRAAAGDSVSIQNKLIIIMKTEDTVFINGSPVSWDEISKTVEDGQFDRSQKVILNIDRQISHGRVIGLLDFLKQQNFKKVVFGTYAGQ